MVLLRCYALPMTPHSSDIGSPVQRSPPPTKTAIFGQNHEIHIHTKKTQRIQQRPLNGTSKMFCASNETTVVWYRLACSEKNSPDENSNFWTRSLTSHSHKVNATHSTEAPEWHFYNVLRFKWHHTRLIWTRQFREDLSRRKQQLLFKDHEIHIRTK